MGHTGPVTGSVYLFFTRYTNFSNLFLEWNSTCFGEFLCPSSGVFHCTHSKPVWHIPLLCVQWKTPDDGQWNCPIHVEFYSKNNFEKLVHLVGFIIRIYHDARSPERQKRVHLLLRRWVHKELWDAEEYNKDENARKEYTYLFWNLQERQPPRIPSNVWKSFTGQTWNRREERIILKWILKK